MIIWSIPLITAFNPALMYGSYIAFNVSELEIQLTGDKQTIITNYFDDIYFGDNNIEEFIAYEERYFEISLNEPIPDNSTVDYLFSINNLQYTITPQYFSMSYDVQVTLYVDIGNAQIEKYFSTQYIVGREISYDRNFAGTSYVGLDLSLRAQLEQFYQYNEGFRDGKAEGYEQGYEQGERDGMNNANDLMTGIGNFLTGVFGALDAFLQTEIIPGLTLWSICLIPIGFGILAFFINLWR